MTHVTFLLEGVVGEHCVDSVPQVRFTYLDFTTGMGEQNPTGQWRALKASCTQVVSYKIFGLVCFKVNWDTEKTLFLVMGTGVL